MRAKLSLAAAAGLTVLAIAAIPAAAAPAAGVKVRSVSAPRSATPGTTAEVDLTAAHRGRSRAAKVAFYLSTDAKRDGSDVRLSGSAKVSKARRSGTSRVGARVKIPAGQALGDYRVLACIGKSCRASKQPLSVTRTPVGTRELVEEAVAAGKLSPQQGLVYRVFGVFGDRRLPAAYAGDDAAPEDAIMREVTASWSQLSAKQRAQLQPFFTPPAAKGSRASASASAAGAEPTCGTSKLARGWHSIAEKDGHVRIWWRDADAARFARPARALLAEAENNIWRKLWDVFGRDALSDAGEHCFHGGDGKLDVYLTRNGEALAKAVTINYPDSCSEAPAYIVFNAGNSAPTRSELAHELTHAFEFAFPMASCSSWDKFDEAVATWGEQYVYPHDDEEHQFVWFTKEPDTPLAMATYDGWVFPYALEQLVGPGVMQRIYEQGAGKTLPVNAIDAGTPGGLAKVYPEFAKLGWNHDPVKPSFWEWDGFDPVPEDAHGVEIGPEQVDLGSAGYKEVDLKQPLKPLSRAYKQLRFPSGASYITVVTPQDPNLHVDGLLKLRDGTTRTEDLSKLRVMSRCPESPDKRVAEMVLVASNTSTYRQLAQDKPIKVVASNIGCSRYVGTASGVENHHTATISTTEKWTATGLVFQRQPDGFREDENLSFRLVGGTVSWSFSGTKGGCAWVASKTFQIPSDGSMGDLGIHAWQIYGDTPLRRYSALGWNLPMVQGTITCPNGTSTTDFRPKEFLKTESDYATQIPDIPGNGVLDGTWSSDEHSGGAYDVTYKWHLEPR